MSGIKNELIKEDKGALEISRTYKVTVSVDEEIKRRVGQHMSIHGTKISESDIACHALKVGLGIEQ